MGHKVATRANEMICALQLMELPTVNGRAAIEAIGGQRKSAERYDAGDTQEAVSSHSCVPDAVLF